MKKIILIVAVLMSVQAFANNPQIRTCRINKAYFWSIKIEQPAKDSIGFCRYDESLIGSITLMKLLYDKVNTAALDAFYGTINSKVKDCQAAGAQRISSIDSEGDKRNLCYFSSDYSFILEKTLTEGWYSNLNAKLIDILK
mgnify:CR=1 FL=1